jgi:murein DD-endopeptidase MepM/ murein hydrolase activator NlpD
MRGRSSGLFTFIALIIVIGGFGFLLYTNSQPTEPLQVVIPTQAEPTANPDALADILSAGFGDDSTPLPTIAIPTERFVAPTLPPAEDDAGGVSAAEVGGQDLAPVSVGATPTPVPPTPTVAVGDDNAPIVMQSVPVQPSQEWQPPPLPVPQSQDPLGRDHYFLARPVDSNANSYGLFYYPYGSGGIQQLSISRVHHGIDFSNPIGTLIRAAGSGTVVFSSDDPDDTYPGSPSYGVVIVIEHDFGGPNDEPIYTLYAHLEQTLVSEGDYVEMRQPIARSGNSGRSSGPHLHFEVRMGENLYSNTYNPVLWIVPYVGHGTVAGRLVDWRGDKADNVFVTARSVATGRVYTTSTYIFSGTVDEVNSDPAWDENFVFGDLPQGRYEIVANLDSQRISAFVDVFEGMTSYVELQPVVIPTAQPVSNP